jgi:pimeloyl-ACP methyl ester carboxylesterase
VEFRGGTLGPLPCLIAGEGMPLVLLGGLAPEAGVGAGPMRRTHELTLAPWAQTRTVYYVNRRPGLTAGMTMAAIAAEHAAGIAAQFGHPVDVLGISTGGSIAQHLAAEHPDAVRRLALASTACRLGPEGRRAQARIAARLRAGAIPEALAVSAAELTPPGQWRLPAALLGRCLGPRLFGIGGLADMATTIEAEDAFDLARLPAVNAPALLVAGGRDRFYGTDLFAETARLIPDCRLELHPRRGHITVLASPRAVAQLRGFLDHP